MPSSARFVVVSFEESECITRSGATTTTYRVRFEDTWRPVQSVPTAVTRTLVPSPSVVWMRLVQLRLPVGTEVEKIVDVPRRAGQASTADVLFGRTSGVRRERRQLRMQVTQDGGLAAIRRD